MNDFEYVIDQSEKTGSFSKEYLQVFVLSTVQQRHIWLTIDKRYSLEILELHPILML